MSSCEVVAAYPHGVILCTFLLNPGAVEFTDAQRGQILEALDNYLKQYPPHIHAGVDLMIRVGVRR